METLIVHNLQNSKCAVTIFFIDLKLADYFYTNNKLDHMDMEMARGLARIGLLPKELVKVDTTSCLLVK